MSYEFFYPGSYSSLDPESGVFSGYRIPAANLGIPTSIQTANQIQEVTNTLNQGGKFIELQPIQPEVFEQIPKQHFREINRLTKLTGSGTSMHAPMIDPAGFAKEGWNEVNRNEAELQLMSVMEKSHELDPTGRVNVTIHASGVPGAEFSKPNQQMIDSYRQQFALRNKREPTQDDMKELEKSQVIAINRDTGQLVPLKREERVYPDSAIAGFEGGEFKFKGIKDMNPMVRTPAQELDVINASEWDRSVTQAYFYKERGDDIIERFYPSVKHVWREIITGKLDPNTMPPAQREAYSRVQGADEYLKSTQMTITSLFDKAYRYGGDDDRRELLDAVKNYEKGIHSGDLSIQSHAVGEMLFKMKDVRPNLYVPVEQFAVEKSAETLGNIAFKAYDKYRNSAPIVSVENLYPGMAFSRSEDLKKLVDASRKKFVENAKKNGMDESEAKRIAERQIGVTWDVGHLNMLKKGGFKSEELVKETEAIAKYVKHVHITDNFGFSDSHLPPGMGNVPIKEIMEQLEKAGYSGKEIIEAGGFVQHFKTSPTRYVLENFGSGMYSEGGPYWNQLRTGYGEYSSGPLAVFPEQHFSMYGPGFSGLPTELGGQIPGKQSRLTGTPME